MLGRAPAKRDLEHRTREAERLQGLAYRGGQSLSKGGTLRDDRAISTFDIKHKFNFYTYAELPGSFQVNVRMQARSAQPITVNTLGGDGQGTAAV